jgi:hypothetical protein
VRRRGSHIFSTDQFTEGGEVGLTRRFQIPEVPLPVHKRPQLILILNMRNPVHIHRVLR